MKKFLSFVAAVAIFSGVAFAAFVDVSTNNPFYSAINYVDSAGIASGYDDGTFRPYDLINRAEFSKIIVGANLPSNQIYGGDCFGDVHEEWFAPFVCTASRKGIATGYSDGDFDPANDINFVEASKMIVRGFDYPTNNSLSGNSWYAPFVQVLSDKKAIPVEINTLAESINRGEMAEIIYRLKNNIRNQESMVFDASANRLYNPGTPPPSPSPSSAESYCTRNGGLVAHDHGDEYCILRDGTRCQIWDYYYHKCSSPPPPPPSPAQLCRNAGGNPTTLNGENICSFGMTFCDLDQLAAGRCSKGRGDSPIPPAPNPTTQYKPYCINNGGEVHGNDCVFVSDLTYCSLQSFYDRNCSRGQQPLPDPTPYYEQKCRNSGGTVDGSWCDFSDASHCPLKDFYTGSCSEGQIPKPAPNPTVNYKPYCLNHGGEVDTLKDVGEVCVFTSDESYCKLQEFYQNECKRGDKPLPPVYLEGPGPEVSESSK